MKLIKKKIPIIGLAVVLLTVSSASAQEETKPKHQFYVGVNLLSPFGSKVVPNTGYLHYSPIAANTCWEIFGEYRYSNFGLRIPVRFPTSMLNEADYNQSYYYFYTSREININQEIGFKPIIYLQESDELFQFYVGAGAYFGNRYTFSSSRYETYTLDNISGTYINYETTHYEIEKNDNENYSRLALTTGVSLQFKNGIGLALDLEVIRGVLRNYSNTVTYSNYGTTNGEFHLIDNYYGYSDYKEIGFQVGLNLFYRFK